MPTTINVLFSGKSIKKLASYDPYGVRVLIVTDGVTGKQKVTAQGFDQTDKPLGDCAEVGCPSPCHPGGNDMACIEALIATWVEQTGEQFF